MALIVISGLLTRLINFVGPVRGDDFRYLALAYDTKFANFQCFAPAPTKGAVDCVSVIGP